MRTKHFLNYDVNDPLKGLTQEEIHRLAEVYKRSLERSKKHQAEYHHRRRAAYKKVFGNG